MEIKFGAPTELVGFLLAEKKADKKPGLVLCRGFPPAEQNDRKKAPAYRLLAKRIADLLGWSVLVFNYRGAGSSEGNFSMNGWLEDVGEAVKYLSERVTEVWLAGFGIGGALSICVGAKMEEVLGVVSAGTPIDFSEWEQNADQLLAHSRETGLISDDDFPPDVSTWKAELTSLEIENHVKQLCQKPLLVIHGADDVVVPSIEARAIADVHGKADIRIMDNVNHRLAMDPRVSSIISGWLNRNTND